MAGNSVVQIKITGEASGAQKAFSDASSAASGFEAKMAAAGAKLDAAGQKMSATGQKMTLGLTLPILGAGAASFKMAADLQDAMGASDQIYGKASAGMKKWAESIPSYYGIAEGEALSYTNMMGSLLKNLGGLSEEEAAKQAQSLTMLAGDLAAMYGGSTEQAVTAMSSALKGNTEMLDNYGISVTAASLKAKAMEMGISSGNEVLNDQQKQAAMLAIIMEQTGDAQGQAGREAKGASGQMRAFTTEMKDLATDLGTKLLPLGTKFIGMARGWLDTFSGLSDGQQDLILKVGGVVAALGPALFIFGKITSGVGKGIAAFGKLGKAIKAVGTAFKAASAFMAANPIGLIIIAVVALGIALYAAYQKFEGFRNVVDTVGRFLRDNFMAGLDAIRAWWDTNGQTIIDAATNVWNSFLTGAQMVGSVLGTVFAAIGGFITGSMIPAFGLLWQAVQGAWNVITTVAVFAWQNVLQPIFDAVAWYITSVVIPVYGLLWKGIQAAWNVITTAANWAWRNVIQPIFNAIQSVINTVVLPIFRTLLSTVQTVWSGVSTAISTAWSGVSWTFNAFKDGIAAVANWVRGRVDDIKSFFGGISDAVGRAFGGVADAIRSPFESAFNAVKRLWNSTVGGFSFTVPDWIPGVGGRGFSIPNMHVGGQVRRLSGESGNDVLRVLQVGERVIPKSQVDGSYGRGSGGSGPVIVQVTNDLRGAIVTRDSERWFAETQQSAIRKGLIRAGAAA